MSVEKKEGRGRTAIYNEIEPYAVEWLRALEKQGHIASGPVDDRSVADLQPDDVRGAAQFHTFAGLGAWSHALRLAGWPDDRPVWTGSCPCQPFSSAGLGGGFDDDRHLWPTWFGLIRECHPPVVFGEQVASPAGLAWLDAVSADLEGAGYAFGAADLCAAGVGAPHIRQRLYFVAIAGGERLEGLGLQLRERGPRPTMPEASGRSQASDLANAERGGSGERRPGEVRRRASIEPDRYGNAHNVADPERHERGQVGALDHRRGGRSGEEGLEQRPLYRSPWGDAEWVACRDGKHRPIEPGSFPLAHGATARVGRLRAYGNAIVPQVAATFIASVMDVIG